jgi:two-component system, response regulator YesN
MQPSQTRLLEDHPHGVHTVLLVDDEPSAQRLLKRWLAAVGRVIVSCRTFDEATHYLADHTPDLLVTDIRLDQYNGLQLVASIKDKQPAVSCVVVTGYDDPVLRRDAEMMHARYLVKPLRREDLLAAIETVR